MQTLNFSIQINAPAMVTYRKMLGLDKPDDYKAWTYAFNPTSQFEGNWEEGSKILFIGFSDEGKREGIVGLIKENVPGKIVTIGYTGLVDGNNEITEGPEIESWANAFESYRFDEADSVTTVTVTLDTLDDFADYFEQKWPEALQILKTLVEK